VVDLRDAGPAVGVGGKAAGLARLIAAGLPVPEGFVITHAAFAATVGDLPAGGSATEWAELATRAETAPVPGELARTIGARAEALGGAALAVRSSVSIEDRAAGAAAGVLSSRTAVAPAQLWPAIRAVWASACTPLVAHYARAKGVIRIEVAVIVQHHVDGDRVTVYTRPPARPEADEVWIERARQPTRRAPRDATDPLVVLAVAAERAIAAPAGADVELIAGDDRDPIVVQARPIVHPTPQAATPPPPALLAPLVADTARRWRRDVEHNPEPLSVAQAGLVAAVDAAGVAPWSMCTVAGYLYWAEPTAAPTATVPISARVLRERFAGLETRMAAAIASAGERPRVADAVAAYVAFYAVWAGEVAPMLAVARAGAKQGHGSPIARAVNDVLRGALTVDALLAEIGDMALAWDVAAPTLREQPELVAAAIAAARLTAVPPASAPATTLAGVALELGELDDVWFARAQAMVRRALLARAVELALRDHDDVFWLPLESISSSGSIEHALDPVAAHAQASAARSAAARAAAWAMPLVAGEPPVTRAQRDAGVPSYDLWRGTGAGRATGRVHRLSGASVVAPGTIVVARTLTPALALLVRGAAGIVSETGGILSHGAAIARELGIPFLVGCDGVWAVLEDGDVVDLDGDAGALRRLDED
jgi:phosphohistidine swiveling domain-containing protein